MKNFKGGFIALMVALVVVLIAACASTPSDPYKPEMSVDQDSPQPRTYNQFRSNWENN